MNSFLLSFGWFCLGMALATFIDRHELALPIHTYLWIGYACASFIAWYFLKRIRN